MVMSLLGAGEQEMDHCYFLTEKQASAASAVIEGDSTATPL
jgi:hypothetical protein